MLVYTVPSLRSVFVLVHKLSVAVEGTPYHGFSPGRIGQACQLARLAGLGPGLNFINTYTQAKRRASSTNIYTYH